MKFLKGSKEFGRRLKLRQTRKAMAGKFLWTNPKKFGGGKGTRTPDPLLAKQMLSQLSYAPKLEKQNCTSEILGNPRVLPHETQNYSVQTTFK